MTTMDEVIIDFNNDDEIFKTLLTKFKCHGIDKNYVGDIIRQIMEEVEKSSVQGSKQKAYAITLFEHLTNELCTNMEDKAFFAQLIQDGVLSSMIELIVAATKGLFNINMPKSVSCGCLPF